MCDDLYPYGEDIKIFGRPASFGTDGVLRIIEQESKSAISSLTLKTDEPQSTATDKKFIGEDSK